MESASYLVVGGCGHQGAHLVRLIRERYPKARVSVMSRNPNSNKFPEVEYYKGDITSQEDVRRVFEASAPTVVLHTAALIVINRKPMPDELVRAVNVDGTRTLLDEARLRGVRAFVYTSSSQVAVRRPDMVVDGLDETYPTVEEGDPVDVYNRTKAEAERIVLAANDNAGMRTCSIRVTAIYGEYDNDQIPGFMGVLREGRQRFQIGNGESRVSWLYAGNAAHGHLLAAEKLLAPDASGVAGEAFILSDGDDVRFWDHARTVWRAAGVDVQPKDVIRMPAFFILLLAMIDEFIASIRGTTPKTSRSAVWFATRDYRFNINKARERLGYAPIVEYEEAVRRGVQWYLENEKESAAKK